MERTGQRTTWIDVPSCRPGQAPAVCAFVGRDSRRRSSPPPAEPGHTGDPFAWQYYRYGECKNSLGQGHWGMCDEDFYENDTVNAKGGQGSIVSVWACTIECSDYIDVVNNA